ncbi:MAG: dihydroorotase family protein [Gaiellales bacterium]
MSTLALTNARLVYADGALIEGGLIARDGSIVAVFAGDPPSAPAGEVIDAGGRYVLPGAIDPHVQLYPLDDHAHYANETGSAAIGGVTTIIKMHRDLSGYPTDAFRNEIAGAERRAHIDFCFHLAVMTDDQIASIPSFAAEFELTSFKLFTAYKGEEGYQIGIQGVDDGQLLAAFRAIGRVGGVALVHCESQDIVNAAHRDVRASGRDGLRAFADARPPIAEVEAIARAVLLASEAGCRLYVVHVTSRQGLDALRASRRDGRDVYAETESHYLTDTFDTAPGNLAKVNPPIRSADDREALMAGLAAGEIDAVGSDHVAVTRAGKAGSVWDARLGFPGVATVLPALLSYGVNSGRLTLADVAGVTATRPASIFGLERKGQLVPGRDADFVVVDLEAERTVDAALLGSASDFSIYEGRSLKGWPTVTVSRGKVIARDGELVGSEGQGRYVRRRAGVA